ncbi:MAG: hypothetical protein WEA24_00295 [Gemmatimonadota bacterium]
MPQQVGLHQSQVGRVWKAHGTKPHRVQYFKLSKDPREKLLDVVGLYIVPPERVIVFSFGEKSQIKAPNRTQPSFPLKNASSSIVPPVLTSL